MDYYRESFINDERPRVSEVSVNPKGHIVVNIIDTDDVWFKLTKMEAEAIISQLQKIITETS